MKARVHRASAQPVTAVIILLKNRICESAMKKWFILVIAGIFILMFVIFINLKVDTYELCMKQHKTDTDYQIIAEGSKEGITAYLGEDDDGILYCDIYRFGKFFGESVDKLDDRSDLLNIYDTTDSHDRIIIVWGKNSGYNRYVLKIPDKNSTNTETERNISNKDHVVDIFVLKNRAAEMMYYPDILLY